MEALKYDRQKNGAINFSLSHPSLRNARMLSFRLFYPVMQANTGIKLFVVRSTQDPFWEMSFIVVSSFFFFFESYFVKYYISRNVFINCCNFRSVYLEKNKLEEIYFLIVY